MRKYAILLLLAQPFTFADIVFWGCAYGPPQVLRSGTLACRQEVRECRKMIISCSQGDKTLFTADDFADAVAMSDDGAFILGMSNRGSANAFWIRDRQGNLIASKPHYSNPRDWNIHYCAQSVTNARIWFSSGHPDAKFESKDGKLLRVSIRGCDGKELLLPL